MISLFCDFLFLRMSIGRSASMQIHILHCTSGLHRSFAKGEQMLYKVVKGEGENITKQYIISWMDGSFLLYIDINMYKKSQ